MPNTTFFNVARDESIHAETQDTRNVPTIYALNESVKGKGAAVAALTNGIGAGVWAVSEKGEGVHAETHNAANFAALNATNTGTGTGPAVYAQADNGVGIFVKAKKNSAIVAKNTSSEAAIAAYNDGGGNAIFATCNSEGVGIGVETKSGFGIAVKSTLRTGLFAENFSATFPTIHALNHKGKIAGRFDGDVEISKNLKIDGTLKVQGDDVMDIIKKYEQRIAKLEKMYTDHKSGIDALPQ